MTTVTRAMPVASPSDEAKIGERITPDPATGCWNWTGPTSRGYGIAYTKHGNVRAHRFVYETLVAPIPDGHHLHHRCENTLCVNPAHLAPVTPLGHGKAHAALRRGEQYAKAETIPESSAWCPTCDSSVTTTLVDPSDDLPFACSCGERFVADGWVAR